MITQILNEIRDTRGTNAKKAILAKNSDNVLLLTILKYTLDPFMPFHIVKVPKVKKRNEGVLTESEAWNDFLFAAKRCADRNVTGNNAIELMMSVFSNTHADQEKWMRKVLKKHLAFGMSQKTVNSVIPNLIPTFDISLAQKFDVKRLKSDIIAIEPKLDGIRCFGIVKGGEAILYARSGKLITNFDSTIGRELSQLPDGCYDGEIMGEDFIALMRQAYRKDDVETESTYLSLFDYLPIQEWESKKSTMSCFQRYDTLVYNLTKNKPSAMGMGSESGTKQKYLNIVKRSYISADIESIEAIHDNYVAQGYEGAMIKDVDAVYKFGRGWEVMKYKAFHDVDLKIKQLLEGTGKHTGKLGSVVVCFKGVDVQVGSGFTDDLRTAIWNDKDSFINRMIEVRYQEETPDGSLRFPTFVCFRNDR